MDEFQFWGSVQFLKVTVELVNSQKLFIVEAELSLFPFDFEDCVQGLFK